MGRRNSEAGAAATARGDAPPHPPEAGKPPGRRCHTRPSQRAPHPPAGSHMRSAARAPRPGWGDNPRVPRPAPARGCAHARQRLGPRPGRGCNSGGCSPTVAAFGNLDSGGGEKWPAAGGSEGCLLQAWRPLLTSYTILSPYLSVGPSRIRSAFWVAVTARSGARRSDELAPPPEAAWPRRVALGLRSGARPGRGREESALEGRGPATAPCLAPPFLLRLPATAPAPSLPTPPLGADPTTASRLPRWVHLRFVGHPSPPLGFWFPKSWEFARVRRVNFSVGNLFYSYPPSRSTIRELKSRLHTVSPRLPLWAVEPKSCALLIRMLK